MPQIFFAFQPSLSRAEEDWPAQEQVEAIAEAEV